jgi:hypothetical protein
MAFGLGFNFERPQAMAWAMALWLCHLSLLSPPICAVVPLPLQINYVQSFWKQLFVFISKFQPISEHLQAIFVENVVIINFYINYINYILIVCKPWPEPKPGQARLRPRYLASAWDLPGHRPTKARPKPWLPGQARLAHHYTQCADIHAHGGRGGSAPLWRMSHATTSA